MDITRNILYRGFLLNDEDIVSNMSAGDIAGCVVETVTWDDTDVIQFMEKRSQQDGMDVGVPELGARRIRMAGTLYGLSRNDLFDRYMELRTAMSPVLAHREEPGDYGYRPLYFSIPTDRITEYPNGAIDLRVLALPRALNVMWQRDAQGGDDNEELAIPWNATFVCRDPAVTADTPQTFDLYGQTHTGTAEADDNLITDAGHGLVVDEAIRFLTLSAGTGLSTGTTYYVRETGLTANVFSVSLTPQSAGVDGAVVNITVDYSALTWERANTVNRGSYIAPVNMLIVVGTAAGSIACVIGDSTFTIDIPASSNSRVIRFKGADKVLTVDDGGSGEIPRMGWLTFSGTSTWPLIPAGESGYTIVPTGVTIGADSIMWFYERHA